MGKLQKKKPAHKKKKGGDDSPNGDATRTVAAEGAKKEVRKPATAQPVPAKAGKSRVPAFWTKSVQFLREVRMELKRVTWPSRKQATGSTVVVVILVAIIAGYLGLVDTILAGMVNWILQ
ncbi:MAG: preprotein translocase subunit SecE [Desulfatibacillaceae bacterium]